MRPRLSLHADHGPLVIAPERAVAARRGRRRRRGRHSRESRLWRRQGRSRCEHRRRDEGRARRQPPMPPASASCRSRSRAIITSAARRCSPSPASPVRRRCCFSMWRRRASGSRPIPGSPTPRCSSSIPASCRSASRSASPLRCGKRTDACRSSPTTAPCSNPMWRRASSSCRSLSGGARRRGRSSSSRCSIAIRRCATSCARRSSWANGVGTCG